MKDKNLEDEIGTVFTGSFIGGKYSLTGFLSLMTCFFPPGDNEGKKPVLYVVCPVAALVAVVYEKKLFLD